MTSNPGIVKCLLWSLITESLRVRDATLNEISADLCRELGPDMSWRLVSIIGQVEYRPAHRVRAARVLESIGATENPADLVVLKNVFCNDEHAEVRDAVGRVIVVLRGGQPDDMSAEEISTFVLEDRGSLPSVELTTPHNLAFQQLTPLAELGYSPETMTSRELEKERVGKLKQNLAILRAAAQLTKSMIAHGA